MLGFATPDLFVFLATSILLLATPGPTNALLASSGAMHGVSQSLVLIPAEILGYMISICVLIFAIGPFLSQASGASIFLRLCIATYLLYLATRLWHQDLGHSPENRTIRFPHVLTVTLLNPKAIVFAFAILPDSSSETVGTTVGWLSILSVVIAIVGFGWIVLGYSLQITLEKKSWSSKIASVILFGVGSFLIASTILVHSSSSLKTQLSSTNDSISEGLR